MPSTTEAPTTLRQDVMSALSEDAYTSTADVALMLEADDEQPIREALFDLHKDRQVLKDERTIEKTGGTERCLVWQIGEPPKAARKSAKKGSKKAKAAKSGPSEQEAVSLRMRISMRSDGSYTAIVRQPGQAKKSLSLGKCDDYAEAGSVALTKVLA